MAKRKRNTVIEMDSATGKVLSGMGRSPLTTGDKRVKSVKFGTHGKRVKFYRHKRRAKVGQSAKLVKFTRRTAIKKVEYQRPGTGRRAAPSLRQLEFRRRFSKRARNRGKIRRGTRLLAGGLEGKLYNLVSNKGRDGISRRTITALQKIRARGASDKLLRHAISRIARKPNFNDVGETMRHRRRRFGNDEYMMAGLGEPLGFQATAKEVFSASNLQQVAWLGAGAIAPEILRRQVVDRFLPQVSQIAKGQVGNAVDFGVAFLLGVTLENFKLISTQNALSFINGAAAASLGKFVKATGLLGSSLEGNISDLLATLPEGAYGDSENDENVGILTEGESPIRTYETERPSRFADTVSPMDNMEEAYEDSF